MTPLSSARLLLDPGPDEARRLLERELSRSDYREPLLERVLGWFQDLVGSVAVGSGGLGTAVSLVVLLVLLGLAALALSRLRRGTGRVAPAAAVFGEARLGAAEHRTAARAAYDGARWDDVVVESVRALAAGAFDRGVLAERAGVTVHELVAAAGRGLPDERQALLGLGRAFDEVRYGDRHADAEVARAALELEARVAATTPRDPTAADPTSPAGAVPR